MVGIIPLTHFEESDLRRVISGYTAFEMYRVRYSDDPEQSAIQMQRAPLAEPYVKTYDHLDAETIERYRRVVRGGWSFCASESGRMVGVLIAEAQMWNSSLWVWEFHVLETYRRQGIGRRMMDAAAAKAREAGLRTIVCETQNTNAPGIRAYRGLGFHVEGIDISYYTNQDYPDGEVAVFMKRRL
jgi:ribosomal protein S18 acetylase RimI-like enzyme